MNIYLYVKRHEITGLKYFGKTEKNNVTSYYGSGKYWLNHIKLHGVSHVKTICYWIFNDQKKATDFALKFSKKHDIVNSDDWANLIDENGINGGSINHGLTTVIDNAGSTRMVPIEEFRTNPDYAGVTKGTITVKDKNGNNYRIPLADPRYISGELVNNRAKMCYVLNEYNIEKWIKFRDYDATKQKFLKYCPYNDYSGYARTGKKGSETKKSRIYISSEKQTEQRRLNGKKNAKPKETRTYTCEKCNKKVDVLEHIHKPIKNVYRCSVACLPGRPKKIKS